MRSYSPGGRSPKSNLPELSITTSPTLSECRTTLPLYSVEGRSLKQTQPRADCLESPTKPAILKNAKILSNNLSAESCKARAGGCWVAEREPPAFSPGEMASVKGSQSNMASVTKAATDQCQHGDDANTQCSALHLSIVLRVSVVVTGDYTHHRVRPPRPSPPWGSTSVTAMSQQSAASRAAGRAVVPILVGVEPHSVPLILKTEACWKQAVLLGYKWRRGSESNRRIKVLQTSPLPLGYRAAVPNLAPS